MAPALLRHSCFSFPPSLHPQDSVKAECETATSVFKVEPGSRPIRDAGGVEGRNFSPIPKDQADAARPQWSFARIVLKQAGVPSPLRFPPGDERFPPVTAPF